MNDPVKLLLRSFAQARDAGDPDAQYCALITLDQHGFPVSRTLTVREISSEGIVVYINAHSPKVDQLRSNPNYELLFFWPSLLRQFRVRGGYQIFSSETQQRNWDSKPYAGKLYDIFQFTEQPQSSGLSSRSDYLRKAEQLRRRFPEDGALEMPPEQVSIRFTPEYIETWFASMEDRLHDRQLYRITPQGWRNQVLVP